jgi:ADP-ribose pyrophosphatase/8-oxo-dGTP diphosphatase
LSVVSIKGEKESEIIENNNYNVLNYEPFCCSQNIGKRYPILVHIFICKTVGILSAKEDESRNLRWISIEQFKRKLINE